MGKSRKMEIVETIGVRVIGGKSDKGVGWDFMATFLGRNLICDNAFFIPKTTIQVTFPRGTIATAQPGGK